MSETLELDDGRCLPLDRYGHLATAQNWDRGVAQALARRDGIRLNQDHWRVIEFVRGYYLNHGIEAPMRSLVKHLRESGAEHIAASRALYRLFPDGPVRQGHRYGGLPIPASCI
ncbi:MAG: TusE/DsrC/DsvC family sulfur relay protein [Xanthomonadales bacterium]|nr:TusE/DsrC/DsvC family sulfur relay protein [Xanthomonadales bacterium]